MEHQVTELAPHAPENHARSLAPHPRSRVVPAALGAAVVAVLVLGGFMFYRAAAAQNHVALASTPKGVTVVEAVAASYRAQRRYVATIEPWVRANIGPQLVSAYVDTVLVRPGAAVKRGDVLATLDCRNASVESRTVAMRARALEARQAALSKESARITGLLDGGFVSPNEVDQKQAENASTEAQLLATRAQLLGKSLEVGDCVLRAPFDGEVADRYIDPGAFVRPGQSIVSLVDRSTVRVVADVPEGDFEVVAPGAEARLTMLATGRDWTGRVARRAPSADAGTRTIRFEIDLTDPERKIPVGTSAEVRIDVGQPTPAAKLPIAAATVRGRKATVFVVADGKAHTRVLPVQGEDRGNLFVDVASLAPGSLVVLEGRALLGDGDRVEAKQIQPRGTEPPAPTGSARPL